MGLVIEKASFSALNLVLGSVNSCWLQLSWQITLLETLIQQRRQGEISREGINNL